MRNLQLLTRVTVAGPLILLTAIGHATAGEIPGLPSQVDEIFATWDNDAQTVSPK